MKKWHLLVVVLSVLSQVFCVDCLADKLTIITTTSPIPSNPDPTILIRSLDSFMTVPGFKECPKIIVFDGIPNYNMYLKDDYEQYKENVQILTETHPSFHNTKLVFCAEHRHLAHSLKEAVKHVKTPYIFVHQHDFKLVKPIDVIGIIRSMDENPLLKHIRLPRHQVKQTCWDFIVDEKIEGVSYVPLCRTYGWSDNDHFARKSYYDNFIFPKIKGKRPMEVVINPIMRRATKADPALHHHFGTYLYGNYGDSRCIIHLDGKRFQLKERIANKNKEKESV